MKSFYLKANITSSLQLLLPLTMLFMGFFCSAVSKVDTEPPAKSSSKISIAMIFNDEDMALHDGVPPQYETSDEPTDDLVHSSTTPVKAACQDMPKDGSYIEISSDENPSSNTTPGNAGQDEYFQVPIPTFSNGLTTFAYQRALRNRIIDSKLAIYAEYDTHRYTPTFVHDCLMLPGSLASILGKVSPQDIIHRMTPALLPGFRAAVHADNRTPCLFQSASAENYVQGMLIFGQGRSGRRRIHRHYRPEARRVKVQVEIDVVISVPPSDRIFPYERWRLQRRKVWAHAWLTADLLTPVLGDGTGSGRQYWTLENYVSGRYDADNALRIDLAEHHIDDDGGVSLGRMDEELFETETREVIYSGCGHLDYERVKYGWGGW